MSTELMTLENTEVPAYILNPELAKQANAEAAAGISTGYAARIKLSGKQFSLVDGNGDETPVLPASMVAAPDGNLYMPIIVLRAKSDIQKALYLSAYNPGEEGKAPDCFSNDGVVPDPSAPAKQCDSCAACPMNAYGSGKDQAGNPTKGKACSDSKILAVFVPKNGVHKFKIPPASLKNWGLYVKQLSDRGIPVGNVKTLVAFDLTASYPILKFTFGGFVAENLLPKLADMAQGSDSESIVNDTITASASAPQLTAPAQAATPAPQAAPAPPVVPDDDLGLDEPTPQAAPAPQVAAPTDADLEAELGL